MRRFIKFERNDPTTQNMSNLPFVSTIDPSQNHNISAEQRAAQLEDRILSLETILKDYVLDSSALKRMIKRQAN